MPAAEIATRSQLRALLLSETGLGFALNNLEGSTGPVVYISTDPKYGRLDLTIKNNLAGPIALGPQSVLTASLSPPLSAADTIPIKTSSPEWRLTRTDDALELRPVQAMRIAPGAEIVIHLIDMLASVPANLQFFVFDYADFGGIEDGSRRLNVVIQKPEKGDPPPLRIEFQPRTEYAGQQGGTVYLTPWVIAPQDRPGIANYMVLQIGNKLPASAIPSKAGADPRIVISFVSGNVRSALCTDEQIKVVACAAKLGPSVGVWAITKDESAPVPVWQLRPPTGSSVFEAAGIVAFRFEGIVSQMAEGPSTLFIQFVDIPNYSDAYEALFLNKVPPVPYIRSFDIYSGTTKLPPASVVGYRQKLTLKWDVFAADRCRLLELEQSFPPVYPVEVEPTAAAVTYTLAPKIVDDAKVGWRAERSLSVSPPVVEKIWGDPDTIAGGTNTTVNWKCSNGSHCLVTGPGAPTAQQPLAGAFQVTLMEPAHYKVTCFGAGATSKEAAIAVPSPEVSITADGRSRKFCEFKWSTRWATSCEVHYLGQIIRNGLQGSFHFGLQNPPWGFRVKFVAKGKGSAEKEIHVTATKPYIEA